MAWQHFYRNSENAKELKAESLTARPPWREFCAPKQVPDSDASYWELLRKRAEDDGRSQERGRSFQLPDTERGQFVVDAVNAAIQLRRPLLVTGAPGSGKTSLAYAIAYQLKLGPVLAWPVTARSKLSEALYLYDAVDRLQDAQLDKLRRDNSDNNSDDSSDDKPAREERELGNYIQLGPVGTAFLPSRLPRVLLIDEIDKSDLNLPNELLNLFEEGEFKLKELSRKKRSPDAQDYTTSVRTADEQVPPQPITNGLVQCYEFPIIIMTSNGERDFPSAFHRRCLRVTMPEPTKASLSPIVRSHFKGAEQQVEADLDQLIADFLGNGKAADRATDQLLNAVYLLTRSDPPSESEMERLKKLLFRSLNDIG